MATMSDDVVPAQPAAVPASRLSAVQIPTNVEREVDPEPVRTGRNRVGTAMGFRLPWTRIAKWPTKSCECKSASPSSAISECM